MCIRDSTNRYLRRQSPHHPAQLQSVVKTLAHKALHLPNKEHRKQELNTLKEMLFSSGYTPSDVNNAIKQKKTKKTQLEKETQKHISTLTLPYIITTHIIGRILKKYHIRTTFNTHTKINAFLQNPKDRIHLEVQGDVYKRQLLRS